LSTTGAFLHEAPTKKSFLAGNNAPRTAVFVRCRAISSAAVLGAKERSMKELVVSAVMLLGAFGLFMASGVHREAPLVGHQSLDSSVASLESEVARQPLNVEKLALLCSAYLDRDASGFAIAAVHRAPVEVRNQPIIRHLWARALLHGGHAKEALAKQREAISSCERSPCSPWLLANAMRHEAFLSAMVARGVEDYRRDPNETLLAYRSMRGTAVAELDVAAE
jgi:hypothetical protein